MILAGPYSSNYPGIDPLPTTAQPISRKALKALLTRQVWLESNKVRTELVIEVLNGQMYVRKENISTTHAVHSTPKKPKWYMKWLGTL